MNIETGIGKLEVTEQDIENLLRLNHPVAILQLQALVMERVLMAQQKEIETLKAGQAGGEVSNG